VRLRTAGFGLGSYVTVKFLLLVEMEVVSLLTFIRTGSGVDVLSF